MMNVNLLDTVVLQEDIPKHGLKKGDIGAVVQIYEPDAIEVEFVTGSGKTQALLTLKKEDIRLISDKNILAVRRVDAA